MNRLKRLGATVTSLVALAVLFVALVALSNGLLKGLRLDLTEDRLYTLSAGTRNIVAAIDEPINLYFYFSEEASQAVPGLRVYASRVRELLEEYAQAAGGNIRLQVVDPEPFSEAEDRATQLGLQGVPVGNGQSLYFGLAGTNALDGVEAIPFFQPDKEAFLEYDVSKLVHTLANPKQPVVGLITTLPMAGGFNPALGQPQQPWVVYRQLQQQFEVRTLAPETLSAVDADVDVLMVVHPKALPPGAVYAIDQFVLRGGKALLFVDPHAEAEQPANPRDPSAMFAERASNVPELLENWGVQLDTTQVMGDRRLALSVGTRPGAAPVQHLAILGLGREQLAATDVVTGELSSLNLAFPGHIAVLDDANTQVEPLLTTSRAAAPIEAQRVRFLADPAQLVRDFRPTGETYNLAVRIGGSVPSAFPDGPPTAGETEGDNAAETTAEDATETEAAHLAESQQPINVVVVADADLLTDRLWVQVQNFFGQQIATPLANNGDFVVNALDNLTGNGDLIGIRGQAVSARPFTTVEALAREAGARLLAKEQELQAELNETERNLAELQRSRSDQSSLILSAEQQAELDRFQDQKLRIRRELRQVRRELDQDIDRLGTTLKAINIGLVPLLLSVFALGAVAVRNKRRAGGQQ
ncbi:MAG: Gldg family protein [Candidatus Competibacterales bacterium]